MKQKLLITFGALALAAPAYAQQEADEAVGAGIGLVIALVLPIVIGAVVGWLASLVVKGSGSGFWGDVLIGIGGSIVASIILRATGITIGGAFGSLIAMFLGAVLLLWIVKLIRKG